MRVKGKTDYSAISRQSVQKDFQKQRIHPERNKSPQIKDIAKIKDPRIAEINEGCQYAKFARFLVGKAVKCVESKGEHTTSGWYKFIFDDDRKALNRAAGWSDNKKIYLLERPKLR